MELWEVGATLGMHRPDEKDEPKDPAVPPDPWADFDPIKARIEAHKAGKPPPTLPPPNRTVR